MLRRLAAPAMSEDQTARQPASAGYREILFWLLLLGSWQFLAAGTRRTAAIGVVTTAVFLVLAARSLDKLQSMGMEYANWTSVRNSIWAAAILSGTLGALVVYGIAAVNHVSLGLSANWSLIVLHLSLGPILEELVFRGYLFTLLQVLQRRASVQIDSRWPTILISSATFAAMHFTPTGHAALQFLCIAAMGVVYGWIRSHSSSTAAAALAHATYNSTLYLLGATALHHVQR